MTSKEEYKGHVRALLTIWIGILEELQDMPKLSSGRVQKVIEGMKLEKEGREVPRGATEVE